jgi:invasion protein IalB
MNVKNIVVAGFTAAALMLSASGALAQDAPAAGEDAAATDAAAAETAAPRDPKDNWLKVCAPLENGQKACLMQQVVVNNNQFIGSFVLRDDPGQESRLNAVAAVPLGVVLPFGLTWQIDGGKPIRLPYVVCDPRSCISQLVVNEAYVNSLKKGAVLKLTAKNRQGADLVVEINLAGFTAVYDGEEYVTFDQLNQDQTGAAALEQQLQDRAETLLRQLAGEEEAPAETPAPQ